MKHLSKNLLYFIFISLFVSSGKADTADQGIFYRMSHGICPEGLQHTIAILAGGAVAVPGIAFNNALISNYNDIHPHVSIGLQSASGLIGAYALYKVNLLLEKRTPQAILHQKAFLLNKIADLKGQEFLTKRIVIEKLKSKFVLQGRSAGLLALMEKYLNQLISDIEWINEKLIALNEPIIEHVDILKEALTTILMDPAFSIHVKINKEYNAAQYNNKLSTKAIRSVWWLTKNGIKTTAQCSWYLTKVAAGVCWDTVKIILQVTPNKI